MTENSVIGRNGDMPWRLSSDLKRFKRTTMGHHLIMGRKTYDSIGRPLPGRTTVVISRTAEYETPVQAARSLDEALALAIGDSEVFITGGAQIYRIALPQVTRIYLTRIHAALDGDTFFPDVCWEEWELLSEERHAADDCNQFDFSFLTYERKI